MKKIEPLNIHFGTSAGYPRHKIEVLHDKINELIRTINGLMVLFALAEKMKLLGIPSEFLKDTPTRSLIRDAIEKSDAISGYGMICTLVECPVGLFYFNGVLCFKSEYSKNGSPDAYVVSSGEYFWGGKDNRMERDALIVAPFSVKGQEVTDSGYTTGDIKK